jgi:putative heme-binding domain-containing protein
VALRDLPLEKIQEVALALAEQYDGQDRFYLEALGLALENKEDRIYPVLQAKLGAQPLNWSPAFADIAWRLHPKAAIPALKQRAEAGQLPADQRKKAIVALGFIKDQQAATAMQDLLASNVPGVKDQALWWLRYRKSNDWSDFSLPLLPAAPVAISAESQKKMLEHKLKLENNATPLKEKLEAATALAKDKVGGEMLIGLAAEKKLSQEVIAEVSKVIFNNPDQSVRVLASDYFKKPGGTTTLSIPKIAKMPGEVVKGRAVFQSKCTSCHRVGKDGADIGPELTVIGKKFEKRGLLDAIVNPSAGMAFGYESWLITKKDGTTAAGFLQADGETLVLKDIAGQQYNIKASEVATRKQFSTSIMPEPTALGLNEKDLANLSEYLLTLKSDLN